jgi:geranylgeranyl pyrophosphate synthase
MERFPGDNPVEKYFARPGKDRLAQAVKMISDLGIAEESYQMARDFCARANEAISVLPDGPDRQTLTELTDYILDRRS